MSLIVRTLPLACALVVLASYAPTIDADISVSLDDIDLNIRKSTPVCVGAICSDSSIFHYYQCCGPIANNCCFKFQGWVLITLIVMAVLFLASISIGLIKCICCCNDR